MNRRTFLRATTGAGCVIVAGCLGGGSETIVDEDFKSTSEHELTAETGETVSIEVVPKSPANQLYMFFTENTEENLEDGSFGDAIGDLDEIEGKTTIEREMSESDPEEWILVIGWLKGKKEYSSPQYSLKVVVK